MPKQKQKPVSRKKQASKGRGRAVTSGVKHTVKRSVKHRVRRVGSAAKHTMLPTERNRWHPHILRYYGLIAIVGLVLLAQVLYSWFVDGRILGVQAEITQAKLVGETNSERVKLGVASLTVNRELTVAAEAKARDMIAKDYWSHNAPDGTKPWYFLEMAGYKYEEAGENLARGFNSAEGIVAAWMDSPSHRANLLDEDYSEVGFGVVNGTLGGKRTTLVVAMYGKPQTAATAMTGGLRNVQTGMVEASEGILVRLRRGFQSLMPSLIFVLAVLCVVLGLAVLAHVYRRKLPAELRKSWQRHHVWYEMAIIVVTGVGAVLSYG